MRHWKKRNKILVIAAMIGVMLSLHADVYADTTETGAITSDSIKAKEAQISEAQKQVTQLQSSLTDIKKLKDQLEGEKNDLKSYVTSLDANLSSIQTKIDDLKSMIDTKEEQIKRTQEELEAANKKQEEQYEAMKERIRFMYEQGGTYYLEMLLESDSYSEMLNKADYIQQLSDYDNQKLEEYATTAQYIEACKKDLDAEKKVLEEAKTGVESEEASLQSLISDKQTQLTGYETDISNKQEAIDDYNAQIADENATIGALEAAVAEEKKKLEEENKKAITYDGGMFAWPAPSYTKVSDDYGNRIHPILGIEQFHNGIDLAAPSGSPILAAYNGDVVAASYSSTMGNYIMIDHGDGLYTIYMHASALYVAKGDTVTKGQQIAAVGTTGRSTGPHLHFSVRLNGSYVSPWNYLSQ